jgi:hypothetical protein
VAKFTEKRRAVDSVPKIVKLQTILFVLILSVKFLSLFFYCTQKKSANSDKRQFSMGER